MPYTIRPIQDAIDYHYRQQMAQLEVLAAKQRAAKKLEELDRKRSAHNIGKADTVTSKAAQVRAT